MHLLAQLAIGGAAFVATNVDDLFLLAALFADRTLRPRSIVAGQLAGIGALVAASAAAALATVALPVRWIALLGIVPLGLGLGQLRRLQRRGDPADPAGVEPRRWSVPGHRSQLIAVAALTVASGGDNLGVYIPLFARAPAAIPLHAATFVALTCVWCWLGHRLVTNRLLADPIRRHGHALLPLVLVSLGVYILSGVFAFAE
jgi:cadmium resistance protein CadD (predicted permease)